MKKLLIISILFISFCSCGVLKKTSEKNTTTKQTEVSNIKKDSVSVVEKTKPIDERIVINVPQTDNKEILEAFSQMMNQISFYKSSGSNSVKSTFDKDLMKWYIDFKIAETKNEKTTTNTSSNTEETFEQQTDEYIFKKIKSIPIWVWGILLFVFRKPLFGFVIELFPGLKTVKWVSRLLE